MFIIVCEAFFEVGLKSVIVLTSLSFGCFHLLPIVFIQFEIFLFLGMTSNFLLQCEYFEYYIKSLDLKLLFQLACCDANLIWKQPHYCKVGIGIQCPHSAFIDIWRKSLLFGGYESVSFHLASTQTSLVDRNRNVSLLLPE